MAVPDGPAARIDASANIVQVGCYAMSLYCVGTGSPTVMLVPGLGGTHRAWTEVQATLASITRVCSCDRLTRARYPELRFHTTRMNVHHLHELLEQAREAPPYILVGQSIGGWDVRLFVGLHRAEVVGAVLSDAAAPDVYDRIRKSLAPAARPSFETWIETRPRQLENLDIIRSARQVESVRSFGDIPLVVLSHGNFPEAWGPQLDRDSKERIESVWQELQVELAGLSWNSIHIVAEGIGHDIHRGDPMLAAAAIREVVTSTRASLPLRAYSHPLRGFSSHPARH